MPATPTANPSLGSTHRGIARRRARRCWWIALAICCMFPAPSTRAATVVVGGEPSATGPLIIDPTQTPSDPRTDTVDILLRGHDELAFIQTMPRTIEVGQIIIGNIGPAPGCDSSTQLQLAISEATTGRIEDATQIAGSRNIATVTTMAAYTFEFSPVVLQAGRSYVFSLLYYTGCHFVSQTTWAHNSGLVDPGPNRCDFGSLFVGDQAGSPGRRMWHVNGMSDALQPCVDDANNDDMFAPDMPTGWLVSWQTSVASYILHGTPTNPLNPEEVCNTVFGDFNTFGAAPAHWRSGTASKDYVCRWTHYADAGTTVPDGWYYGLPWTPANNGAPRDRLLELLPADQVAAERFEPVLRFDSSEQWRPLNVDSFASEGNHAVCDPSCSPMASLADLEVHRTASAYIDIAGTFAGSGDEANFHSPYAECTSSGLRDCDTGPRSSIYYRRAGPFGGYRYIDYWFFYRANYFFGTIDFHEGDWEGVTIAPSQSDPYTFDYAAVSQHGTFYSYMRSVLRCEDTPATGIPPAGTCGQDEQHRTGRRLAVMVANGSHANYTTPCSETFVLISCRQNGAGSQERGYDGAKRWGRAFDPPSASLIAMPQADGSSWSDWPGLWGHPATTLLGGDGPASPALQTVSPQCATIDNGVPPSCALGPRSANGVARSPGLSAESCSSWAGPGVQLTACDPAVLQRAVRMGRLNGTAAPLLRSTRARREGSVPGLTQIVGPPLRAGASIQVGPALRARHVVYLRVAAPRSRRILTARFQGDLLHRAAVVASSQTSLRLRIRGRQVLLGPVRAQRVVTGH